MTLRSLVINATVVLVTTLATSIALDHTLGWLGYPDEVPDQVVHPPNYSERRDNIEFSYAFRTNSQGLRSPEIPLTKAPGEYRVLVVGDSFVEGIGMDGDETLPAFLERRLGTAGRPVTFINAGLSGTGPIHYGRVILDMAPRYDVDAVLVCLFANDLYNTWPTAGPEAIHPPPPPARWGWERLTHGLWPRTHTLLAQLQRGKTHQTHARPPDFVGTVSAEARRRGIPDSRIEAWRRRLPAELVASVERGELSGNILSYGLLSPTYWSDSIDIDTPTAEAKWGAMARVMGEIVGVVRGQDRAIGLVYLPSKFQYDPASHAADNPWPLGGAIIREGWLQERGAIQDRLSDLSQALAVEFLDLTPHYRAAVASGETLNWTLDEHLTPRGNAVTAGLIADWIRDRGVFEARPQVARLRN